MLLFPPKPQLTDFSFPWEVTSENAIGFLTQWPRKTKIEIRSQGRGRVFGDLPVGFTARILPPY